MTTKLPVALLLLSLLAGPPSIPLRADPANAASSEQSEVWPVPAAAWQRPLGDHPLGATGKNPPSDREPAQSRTKRGIPLGGIGTGSFMYNLAGSFGPWEFDIGGDDSTGADWGVEANRGHEERFLAEAAFHVYQRSGATSVVRTLATEDVLPAWPRLEVGQGDYFALFPKGWFRYDGLLTPLGLKHFSPFVAGNYRLSSLPVALFQFAATNPTDTPVDLGVMFTWPNAIYRRDTTDYNYPRAGLTSRVELDDRTAAVRLQAEDPGNVPETQQTEWVIAARGSEQTGVTYAPDWSPDGGGADVLADFADDGALSNTSLDPRRRGLAGAVALTTTLEPGERIVLPFALAWDFPVVQFRNTTDGTRWLKRYKQWYPGRYRAWDIAREALDSRAAWERAVDAWWRKIAHGRAYPLWLRRAALNELYYDVFGGVFWEASCVTKPKRFGARRGQHLYFTHEANVYQDAETLDVRYWETRHLLTLFPRIERDVLLAWADFIRDDPHGKTPHDAGTPANDPYFVYGQYSRTSRGEQPPQMEWRGLPSRFVQQAHAYWKQTGDRAFLRAVWPAAVRTMRWLARRDSDGDGLPNGGSGPEGARFRGESIIISSLYIGALQAMADMGDALELRVADRFAAKARRARRAVERVFWAPRLGYYRFSTGGPNPDALMTGAMNAQRYAEVNGLRPILRPARMRSHLRAVYRRAVLPFGNGRIGAVNGVAKSGEPLRDRQMREVWPGNSYFVAALMHRAGLERHALRIGRGIYRLTYESDRTAYWFDTPEAWLAADITRYRAQQYQRARAVWELLLEIKNPFD